jgi:hypothetical protein
MPSRTMSPACARPAPAQRWAPITGHEAIDLLGVAFVVEEREANRPLLELRFRDEALR